MEQEPSVVVAVGAESFAEEVVGSARPAVVHFWAPGHAACLAMAEAVEELGREWAGRVHFVRVDVEAEPGLGAIFGVGRVPALLYYEGGAPWELWSGESGGLREWVEGHLARGGAGALHFRTTT